MSEEQNQEFSNSDVIKAFDEIMDEFSQLRLENRTLREDQQKLAAECLQIRQIFHRIGVDLQERDKQWQVAFAAIQYYLAKEFPEQFQDESGKARNLIVDFLKEVYPHLVDSSQQKANTDTIVFTTEATDESH